MSKVSVIIPCYNKDKYISEAVSSVLNQTYPNIEIIIINDGSTDNSVEIISTIVKSNPNIKFINNNKNEGVIFARNTAIDASTGDYILPLDADDTIEPTYIEKAVKILDNNKNVGIVYCRAKYIGIKNEEWVLPEYTESSFLYGNCIFCTALFRKTDFIKAGKYKENAVIAWEDWDLWLSIIELGLIPYRINEILFNYRQVEENTRSQYTNSNLEAARKIILQNHFKLYLNSPNFVNNCFLGNDLTQKCNKLTQKCDNLTQECSELRKKRNKYKKLFNYLLSVMLIEILIFIIFIFIWFGG